MLNLKKERLLLRKRLKNWKNLNKPFCEEKTKNKKNKKQKKQKKQKNKKQSNSKAQIVNIHNIS